MTERNSCKKFIDRLSRLNLYDEREDIADVDQILSTRIFLILILILVYTITMFSVVSLQTQIHSVTSPSETLFNDLSVKYSEHYHVHVHNLQFHKKIFFHSILNIIRYVRVN